MGETFECLERDGYVIIGLLLGRYFNEIGSYASYKKLQKTTGGKSEYGFQELDHHLDLVQGHLRNKFRKTKDESVLTELQGIVDAQREISKASKLLRGISSNWGSHLLPRSEEVILPISEVMLGLEKENIPPSSKSEHPVPDISLPDRFSELANNLGKV